MQKINWTSFMVQGTFCIADVLGQSVDVQCPSHWFPIEKARPSSKKTQKNRKTMRGTR